MRIDDISIDRIQRAVDLGQYLLGRELLVCHIYSVFWDVSTYRRVDGFELAQQIKDRFAGLLKRGGL